jgi:hypothetical protein
VVAALTGGPLTALLPVLADTLASQRQSIRVTEALAQITTSLQALGDRLNVLTDPQYKVINETVLTLFQTTSEGKVALLRHVIRNTTLAPDLTDFEATALSRLVRDLSAEECEFIRKYFGYGRVALVTQETKVSDRAIEFRTDSREGSLVAGLTSLGVLMAAGGTYDDMGTLRFMPLAAKLLALLRTDA